MRLVLDQAATVGEAVAIFRRTAIDFSGGPPLHYMVADASGDSAVVEYVDGRVRVIPRGERPFQAMTNFVLTGDAPRRRPLPHRDERAAPLRRPPDAGRRRSPCSQRVAQPHTRWSVAYDLRARTAHVVMGQKYGGRVLTFSVGPSRSRAPSSVTRCRPRRAIT